mgnify:CR=1 FL=1
MTEFEDKAKSFGLKKGTFASYCLKYFLYNYKDQRLPELKMSDRKQMNLPLDDD